MNKEFRLPDVGEGLTEADIVSWHVKPGDTVTINQVIVEIETAKAVVELPSPYAGTVSALLVDEGQTVDVGVPDHHDRRARAGEAPAADTAPAGGSSRPARRRRPSRSRRLPAATPAPPARQPVSSGTASSRARPAAAAEEPADPAGFLPGHSLGTAQRRPARDRARPDRSDRPRCQARLPRGGPSSNAISPSRRFDGSPGTSASTSAG